MLVDTRRSSSRFRLLAVLALIVIAAAGCGTGPVGRGPVATVNGTEISRSDLDALIAAQLELIESGAAQAREQAESPGAQFTIEDVERSLGDQLAQINGSGSGTISTDAASRQLGELVQLELLRAALDEVDGEVTDQHRQQARSELEAEIQQSGLPLESVPDIIVEHYVELAAVNAALQSAVPDDVGADLGMSSEDYEQSLMDIFEQNGASYRQICFFGPVFDDQASADEAFDRLDDDEDLAAVAADLASDDPMYEAPLDQCETIPAGSLVEFVGEDAFTAEAGHVFEPVEIPEATAEAESLWIVVVVDDVDVPEFDDVREQLTQDFPNTSQAQIDEARNQYLDELLMSVFDDAEVTIDPRYGTWEPDTGSVVPPADPAAVPPPPADFGDLELVEPAP